MVGCGRRRTEFTVARMVFGKLEESICMEDRHGCCFDVCR
jgi:hypothetical protein